jgi:hypothetical protein
MSGNRQKLGSGFISQARVVLSGFCPDARRDEGAYSQKSVTEEQRSGRAKDTENVPPDLMKPLLGPWHLS